MANLRTKLVRIELQLELFDDEVVDLIEQGWWIQLGEDWKEELTRESAETPLSERGKRLRRVRKSPR